MAPKEEQHLSKLKLNSEAILHFNKQAETRDTTTHYLF